ncbi:hypothetical protein [Dysosmobacter sp.]
MERGIFDCPAAWVRWLPEGVRRPGAAELALVSWELLALTPCGAQKAAGGVHCRLLLLPGESVPLPAAQTIISYGLSHRDSLTLSSLQEPVLCIQRALPRPDGTLIEPQELPLPHLPGHPLALLPLLGLRLLQMPLTDAVTLR